MTALRVVVDGEALSDGDAIAMWQRFSAYMDEHKGDLGGFAKREGFVSIHPAMEKGMPVLVASRTAGQKAYASVEKGGGSKGGGGGGGGGSKGSKGGGSNGQKSGQKNGPPKGGAGRDGSSGHQGAPRDPPRGGSPPGTGGGKPGKRR